MAKKVSVRSKGGKTTAKKSKTVTKKAKPAEKKAKLATIKTTENSASVSGFINKLTSEQQRKDSFTIIEMMKKATGAQPKMWGGSIIGFGNKIYKSPATNRAVEWFVLGFSPRKANLTLYLMNIDTYAADLKKLGKHKVGGGCLYINKLLDVDGAVLKGMITAAAKKNK